MDVVSGRSLTELESIVERGIAGWIEAALAWKEIRDKRRYRDAGYADFDTYSRERWSKDRHQIDAAIRYALTAQELGEISPNAVPENPAQARELAAIEPDRRAEIWREAVETYGEQPTAKQIRDVASPPMLAVVDLETGEIVDAPDEPEPIPGWPSGPSAEERAFANLTRTSLIIQRDPAAIAKEWVRISPFTADNWVASHGPAFIAWLERLAIAIRQERSAPLRRVQ